MAISGQSPAKTPLTYVKGSSSIDIVYGMIRGADGTLIIGNSSVTVVNTSYVTMQGVTYETLMVCGSS
jgi:hypothetical protein